MLHDVPLLGRYLDLSFLYASYFEFHACFRKSSSVLERAPLFASTTPSPGTLQHIDPIYALNVGCPSKEHWDKTQRVGSLTARS